MPSFDPTTTALMIAGVMGFLLGGFAYLTLAERKVSAWIQDRIGPNRVGPGGLLQPIADGGKFFLKEDVIPDHVDKVFFLLAPIVGLATAFLAIAVVPVGATLPPPGPQSSVAAFEAAQSEYRSHVNFAIAPGLDVGILYVFAIGSLAVYGVILAGWSANNKYSLLGSLRSSAQIVSYEIPLGMSILGVFLIVGSLNLETVIDWQVRGGWWMVAFQPLAFLLFLVSTYAECARLPFDLPEAEQELVGGYHTEYTSMKLAMLLMAEYFHLVTTSFVVSIAFFGGWSLFGLEGMIENPVAAAVVKLLILVGKMSLLVILSMVVRWTIPRFRFDQLMNIAWKVMIPLATLNLLCVLLVKQFEPQLAIDGRVPAAIRWPYPILTLTSLVLVVGAGVLTAKFRGSVTNPRGPVKHLPPGIPPGVTYASR